MRLWIGLTLGVVILGAAVASPSFESTKRPGADTTDVLMWTGASNFLPEDSLLFQTKLAFAERQNIIPYESGIHDAAELRRFLRACRMAGIERSWIEIGPCDYRFEGRSSVGAESENFST